MERLALVTGGSRGIGRAIAKALRDRGLSVVVASRDPERGRAAARELGAEWRFLDLADAASVAALARTLEGGLDVLVDNAAIALKGFDAKIARATLLVDFLGTMRLTDTLVPRVREGGRIVMVSSGVGSLSSVSSELAKRFLDEAIDRDRLVALTDDFVADVEAGRHAERGWPTSAYGVSKIALNTYTRILARELERDPRRIKVNAACPGWVRTDMGGNAAPRSPDEGAKTPVWLALLPDDGPTGGFFRDEKPIPW